MLMVEGDVRANEQDEPGKVDPDNEQDQAGKR